MKYAHEVAASLAEGLRALKACENNGYVLAWPNGLGVRFLKPGEPQAVPLELAEEIVSEEQALKMPEEAWAYIPIVKNGHGECARLVKRQVAIAAEIVKIEQMIAEFA